MSKIDYKAEVRNHFQNYIHVYFENFPNKHHIRYYTGLYPYGTTVATGNTEPEAWQSAYEQLKKEGKIK